jgi:pyrroline-5-carboxylate reductase
MRIGILGVGHLGAYLVRGLISAGTAPGDLLLSPRGTATAAALAERHGVAVAPSNAAVVADSDVVVLAVRPGDAAAAVAGLPWTARHLLVSTCAGVRLDALRPSAAPAAVVRAMPISAVAIGRSPTTIFPDHPLARAVFSRVGEVLVLPDEEGFSVASVSAALYGWVHELIGRSVAWSAAQGLPEPLARRLQAQTFAAAAGMVLDAPDLPVDELVRRLATPGGITEAGLDSLRRHGTDEAWTAAQDAAFERLRALGGPRDPSR